MLEQDTDVSDQLFSSTDESDIERGAAERQAPKVARRSKRNMRVSWEEGVKPPSTKSTLVTLLDAVKVSSDKRFLLNLSLMEQWLWYGP